jgi:hypothetical protein
MATIYGDNTILDDIRAELYAQMNNLCAAMVAGAIAPLPAAVQNTHEFIATALPAISVGITKGATKAEQTGRAGGASPSITIVYSIECDIRVHTDYDHEDAYQDEVTQTQLLNSISNWLTSHDNLNLVGLSHFDIDGINLKQKFEESLTVGGSLSLTLIISRNHTQAGG